MTFSAKLQELRKAQGLSQEMLAEKCGVTRQSVSKWETGLGYPETEKLLALCDLLGVSADCLLRDTNNTNSNEKKAEQASPYTQYIGKWVQVFLKDKEFNGFYCIALVAIQDSQLLFVDDKCKAILIAATSISTISNFTKEKQMKKLPPIPDGETIADVGDCFINRTCDIKMKQEHPLFGFNKPGGFYSVLIDCISADAATAHNLDGGSHIIKMADVLFIKEK